MSVRAWDSKHHMRPITEYFKRPKYLPQDIVRFFNKNMHERTYKQAKQACKELWLIPKL
jgi:hypothetical protein